MLANAQINAIPQKLPFVGWSDPDPRRIVARNIRALIDYDRDHGGPCYDKKRLALRAGLTPSTVGRILSLEHAPGVDTLDDIAHAFGLLAWQLLVPNLGLRRAA
jgi:transcriptional regulator with XRE-family HTH domain